MDVVDIVENEQIYEIIRDALCEGCESIKTIRGYRDRTGFQIEPDDATCPLDFNPEFVVCDTEVTCSCKQ